MDWYRMILLQMRHMFGHISCGLGFG